MSCARRFRFNSLMVAAALSLASMASAQTQPAAPPTPPPAADDAPSVGQLFTGALTNFRRLPNGRNLAWLTAGGLGAAATHPLDAEATRALAGNSTLHEPLKGGAVLGGTPFELGAAFATYGMGRALNRGRVARLGADLIQAQLMAESLAMGVKQTIRRSRPEGSGFSFPSGHTTVAFSSADVLQRTFGWKVGVPAYAVASYVAASRVQDRRHYLSDVVFGAALGTIAGRTVTVGHGRHVTIDPIAAPGCAGLVFELQRARP